MSAQPQPPIRKFQLLDPISVTQPLGKTVDVFVSDFGQNIAGWARLSLANCPSGTLITLRFAEVLCGRGPTTWSKACSPPGVVDQRNLRAARATDTYTCSGEAEEVWEPRTTYHGFRFVQVMPHSLTHSLTHSLNHSLTQPSTHHSTIHASLNHPRIT